MRMLKMMEFPQLQHKSLQIVQNPVTNNLFTIPGLLSVQEAQACIDYAESLGFQHQGSRGPAYGEAFRDNDRVSIQDQGIANCLWHGSGLSKVMKGRRVDGATAAGCNPNIRFYRYRPGHRFGKHIDDSVELEDGSRTWYTVLVYLSGQLEGDPGADKQGPALEAPPAGKRAKRGKAAEPSKQAGMTPQAEPQRNAVQDLQGGETAFYSDRGKLVACVQPRPGLALLHLHGEDRCMEHEALAVKQGTKYILRTDIVFR